MKKVKTFVLLATLSCGLSWAAPTLELRLMKIGTVTENGKVKELLTPATTVKPGDLLLQRAVLTSEKALISGHIVLPVPKNTHYLAGSAQNVTGLVTDFSADGGKTFSELPMKTVKVEGSTQTKLVPVPPVEYTTVRWTVKAVPAGSVTVNFRVVVN